MRRAIFGCVVLFGLALPAWAESPAATQQENVVHAHIKGTLYKKSGIGFYVLTNNLFPNDVYSIALLRSEDKNRDLDAYLVAHEGEGSKCQGCIVLLSSSEGWGAGNRYRT